MSNHVAQVRCYLVEWYTMALSEDHLDDTAAMLEGAACAASRDNATVELVAMLAVPDDEIVFGVFTAASAELVAQVCHGAGLSPQRLTPAFDTRFPIQRG